jgi:peptidoglycan/xylan/chitin deacetylase (PgdA/CDA1 family)
MGVSRFTAIIEWIATHYAVIPLTELAARLRAGRPVRGAASLTFDDAYRGALVHAAPVLKQRALAATVFIVTDAANEPRPFWWDLTASLPADARARFLRELAGDGSRIREQGSVPQMTLPSELLPADWSTLEKTLDELIAPGNHTARHRNLSALSAQEVSVELRTSQETLAARLGRQASLLAYPYGFASRAVVEASGQSGFAAAVTLGFGCANRRNKAHALPRVNVPANLPIATLNCWASGVRVRPAPIRFGPGGMSTRPSGVPAEL